MAKLKFITRADDAGSSHSANLAICKVTKAGFIKNVSLMAPGLFIEEAACLLAHRKEICFGMHTTLNAEWDRVKWKPVLPVGQHSGLVDKDGYFLPDPSLFADTKPPLETVMAEVNAQFERLRALGFDIRYIDSHMFPEMFIDGLDDAIREFAQNKGLLDHMHYYTLPPGFMDFAANPSHPLRYLASIPPGQYFLVTHPSLYTDEMRQTGNATVSGETIAKGRAQETKLFSGVPLRLMMKMAGAAGIRYDQAEPQKRATVDDLRKSYQNSTANEKESGT